MRTPMLFISLASLLGCAVGPEDATPLEEVGAHRQAIDPDTLGLGAPGPRGVDAPATRTLTADYGLFTRSMTLPADSVAVGETFSVTVTVGPTGDAFVLAPLHPSSGDPVTVERLVGPTYEVEGRIVADPGLSPDVLTGVPRSRAVGVTDPALSFTGRFTCEEAGSHDVVYEVDLRYEVGGGVTFVGRIGDRIPLGGPRSISRQIRGTVVCVAPPDGTATPRVAPPRRTECVEPPAAPPTLDELYEYDPADLSDANLAEARSLLEEHIDRLYDHAATYPENSSGAVAAARVEALLHDFEVEIDERARAQAQAALALLRIYEARAFRDSIDDGQWFACGCLAVWAIPFAVAYALPALYALGEAVIAKVGTFMMTYPKLAWAIESYAVSKVAERYLFLDTPPGCPGTLIEWFLKQLSEAPETMEDFLRQLQLWGDEGMPGADELYGTLDEA